MIVMKFGGTSVENATAIERVARIVRGRVKRKPVVVVSAMAGVTNALVRMAEAAVRRDLQSALDELSRIKQQHEVAARALTTGTSLDQLLSNFDKNFEALELLL